MSEIAKILGATKNIVARDSKTFAQEIGKYIDSKDQKRGNKKDKKKSKDNEEKSKQKNKKDKRADPDAPALWPLIRQVNVRCPAAALLTGAVLVDLPGRCLISDPRILIITMSTGTADANAARSKFLFLFHFNTGTHSCLHISDTIAKDYMKKCDCIWVLAPITRAVDDKVVVLHGFACEY